MIVNQSINQTKSIAPPAPAPTSEASASRSWSYTAVGVGPRLCPLVHFPCHTEHQPHSLQGRSAPLELREYFEFAALELKLATDRRRVLNNSPFDRSLAQAKGSPPAGAHCTQCSAASSARKSIGGPFGAARVTHWPPIAYYTLVAQRSFLLADIAAVSGLAAALEPNLAPGMQCLKIVHILYLLKLSNFTTREYCRTNT